MKKVRLFFFLLVLVLCVSVCSAISPEQVNASTTLAAYGAIINPGDSAGDVVITYDVRATSLADKVGVETISIYKSTGQYVTTIYGSTTNGLIITDSSRHRSSYTYSGTPGVSYCAVVTVFAEIGDDYDSHAINTGDAIAPTT